MAVENNKSLQGILLESGTNELEVLEFKVNNNYFGINVAKVSEIIMFTPVTPIPAASEGIKGVIMPRDRLITVIDLSNVLFQENGKESGYLIITNFNNLNISFMVDEVIGIKRISWAEIIKPGESISNSKTGVITGIIKDNDQLISILDFEKIVTDISPELGLKVNDLEEILTTEKVEQVEKEDITVLIAEDSHVLNNMLVDCIKKAGYKVINTFDGQSAWDNLMKAKDMDRVYETIQCVITDIEMPRMDGITLAKKIKEDKELNKLPVIVFSSLVNDALERKVKHIGIDGLISKPEIGKLVGVIEELVRKSRETL